MDERIAPPLGANAMHQEDAKRFRLLRCIFAPLRRNWIRGLLMLQCCQMPSIRGMRDGSPPRIHCYPDWPAIAIKKCFFCIATRLFALPPKSHSLKLSAPTQWLTRENATRYDIDFTVTPR
jgi:hypothetical protein